MYAVPMSTKRITCSVLALSLSCVVHTLASDARHGRHATRPGPDACCLRGAGAFCWHFRLFSTPRALLGGSLFGNETVTGLTQAFSGLAMMQRRAQHLSQVLACERESLLTAGLQICRAEEDRPPASVVGNPGVES